MRDSKKKLSGFSRKCFLVIIDIILFFATNAAIYYFSNDGILMHPPYSQVLFSPFHFILTSILAVVINYYLGLYASVWAYASTDEMISCILASVADTVALLAVDKILFHNILQYKGELSYYSYILVFMFLIVCTNMPRLGYKVIRTKVNRHIASNKKANLKRVMIVGAGYMGNAVINDIKDNQSRTYKVVIAIDDNPAKKGKRINNVKIVGNCEQIPFFADKYNIDEIVICIPSASKKRQQEIFKTALSTGKKVKVSPSIQEFLENNNRPQRARNVGIADLLARDEVNLDIKVCRYLIDKTILVTGGGGSIGSEICTQCARYKPKTIVIFDIYENCAFDLANELIGKYGNEINIQVRIGSVRDIERLNEVFNEFHPDVVFHAAAHKHVPLMEDSPCEAVKNNVFGTYNVAVTADKFKVHKMVILSTDKAVNPTNVMGATKRITEIIIEYMNKVSSNTEYAAVRFGNVLGSHGSVVPIFKRQIEQGGPVCVTHPDITRYFMTIPEAAQLVCQAGGLAKGGEIFVLDMGEPVKIMELAENLIKLSGYTVEEIGIKIVGLRPGEKLYEELAMDIEMSTRQKTANEKIYVIQPINVNKEQFESMLDMLRDIDEYTVREKLKAILPNYCPSEKKEGN